MSYYRDQLENWLKQIDVKADRVLDIGGSAYSVRNRTKSWDVNDYYILDNGNEKDWHEKWTVPHIDLNIESSPEPDFVKYRNMFDMVFMLEVAEYLIRPHLALGRIHSLLKGGGVAYMSFPSIYPVHNPIDSDSLRYTRMGITKLLHRAGFHNIDITPRVATAGREALRSFYRLEGMRAVKDNDCIYDIGYMVKAVKN